MSASFDTYRKSRERNPRSEHRLFAEKIPFCALPYQHTAGETAEEDRKHIAPAYSRSAAAEFRPLRKLPVAQSNALAREIIDIRHCRAIDNRVFAILFFDHVIERPNQFRLSTRLRDFSVYRIWKTVLQNFLLLNNRLRELAGCNLFSNKHCSPAHLSTSSTSDCANHFFTPSTIRGHFGVTRRLRKEKNQQIFGFDISPSTGDKCEILLIGISSGKVTSCWKWRCRRD